MNQPVGYLREILSNYTERSDLAQEIYALIKNFDFTTEESFVEKLSEEQVNFLEQILPEEMKYAEEGGDDERLSQLNEVYELLY